MPLPLLPLGLAAGGALLGGLAGSMDKEQSQSSKSTVKVGEESEEERRARLLQGRQLSDIEGLVNAGPGMDAVTGANQANAQLGGMLQDFSQGGFLPGAQDISAANQFTQSMFAPQQQMLNNQFEEQRTEQARMAAMLGRPVNDPVLQNKMMQTQAREQANLGANMTAFSANQAQQMPLQRLGFTQDLAGLKGGLATQAMSNRQALLGMGNQIQQQGRQFRLDTATRTNNTQQKQPGGLAGGIGGALAGAGMGMQAFSMFGGGMGGAPSGGMTNMGMQTGGQTGQFNGLSTGMVA